ncbi:hypothetical protein RHECNPAF_4460058 [Rhizobium etli CNPAF512]|nr:hypothetical protein RHECNPAF_4460058 [Rhizobium etli CNPAF512]
MSRKIGSRQGRRLRGCAKKRKGDPKTAFPEIEFSQILFCCRFRGCCCFSGGLGFGSFCRCLFGGERLSGGNLFSFDACLFLGNGGAFGVVELAGADAGVFNDTGRLAATVAEVIELGATDLTAADDVDAFDQRRVDREYALDTFAVGDLANGEVFLQAAAGAGDADAFIGLNAGTVAFRDLHVDADGVARGEFGEGALGFDLGGLFGLELLNDVHRLNLWFF